MTIVIGGGISGVSCAQVLNDRGHAVTLIDRGHRLGGRMALRTIRNSGTRFDGRVVDIGASYFTVSDPLFSTIVQGWVDRGLARPWTDAFHVDTASEDAGLRRGPMRYAATHGLRSLVEDIAVNLSSTIVESNRTVGIVEVRGGELMVDDSVTGAVALCMPDPQARAIVDVTDPQLRTFADATLGIEWEPTIAVTALYAEQLWAPFDGIFVNDSPVLTWIANDGSRRGDGAPALVAHVNPILASQHLAAPEFVGPMAIAALAQVLGIDQQPAWFDVQRWTFARPLMARPEVCFLDGKHVIGLAGDAWAGGPRIEAAWLSGAALGGKMADRLDSHG